MQLDLGSDHRTDILRRMQAALIARFGRIIRPPDKRRSPVWVLVHGVIGAQTKTAASNASTDALLAEFGSWEAVAEVSEEELANFGVDKGAMTLTEPDRQRFRNVLSSMF